MKIKRILSAVLISLVLCSTGYYAQEDFTVEPGSSQAETEAQLIEDSEDAIQEFRETIKVSIGGARTRSINSFYDVSNHFYAVSHHAQFDSYRQKHFFLKPTTKRFVDQGALII